MVWRKHICSKAAAESEDRDSLYQDSIAGKVPTKSDELTPAKDAASSDSLVQQQEDVRLKAIA